LFAPLETLKQKLPKLDGVKQEEEVPSKKSVVKKAVLKRKSAKKK
jgi:hypothetical protein